MADVSSDQPCPHCGHDNPLGAALCGNCLDSLPGQRFVTLDTPPAPAVPRPAHRDQQSTWVCPVCRQETGTDEPFCPSDGTPRPEHDQGQSVGVRLTAPGGEEFILLDGDHIDLGRESPDSHTTAALSHLLGVSRHHASLTLTGHVVTVVDHDSMNGTRVNGQLVKGSLDLDAADLERVDLGHNATIRCTTQH